MNVTIYCPHGRDAEPLRNYCRAFGWRVIAQHSDLRKALDEIRRKPGVFAVPSLDSLGPHDEWIHTTKQVRYRNCEFVALADRVDTTTPEGAASLQAIIAAVERVAGKTPAKKRPKPDKRPFGVNAQEQETLTRIRELDAEGLTPTAICRKLTAEQRKRRGGSTDWVGAHSWIKKLLAQPSSDS